MDKEVASRRLELLFKLDSIKDNCECKTFNINCDNCKKMKSIGDKLKSTTMNKENFVVPVTKQDKLKGVEILDKFLTPKKYIEFKNARLSDEEIVNIYQVNSNALVNFKRKHNIKVKKYYKQRTEKENKKAEKIIRREKEIFIKY